MRSLLFHASSDLGLAGYDRQQTKLPWNPLPRCELSLPTPGSIFSGRLVRSVSGSVRKSSQEYVRAPVHLQKAVSWCWMHCKCVSMICKLEDVDTSIQSNAMDLLRSGSAQWPTTCACVSSGQLSFNADLYGSGSCAYLRAAAAAGTRVVGSHITEGNAQADRGCNN